MCCCKWCVRDFNDPLFLAFTTLVTVQVLALSPGLTLYSAFYPGQDSRRNLYPSLDESRELMLHWGRFRPICRARRRAIPRALATGHLVRLSRRQHRQRQVLDALPHATAIQIEIPCQVEVALFRQDIVRLVHKSPTATSGEGRTGSVPFRAFCARDSRSAVLRKPAYIDSSVSITEGAGPR